MRLSIVALRFPWSCRARCVASLTFYDYGPPMPSTNTVFEGQSAQFSLTGLSLGGYAFQWQRLTTSNTWVDIPGADAITFTMPSVRKTDAGPYRAVSSYECASGATQPGLLNVLGRPGLQATIASADNTLLLSGSGPSGFSYQIEASDDLAHWADFRGVTNAPASWQLVITNASGLSQRYFRLRVLP